MIIVHQMAKVGSQSWVQAAKSAAERERSKPFHCHFMVPANRARIAAAYDVPDPRSTIANMLMPRNLLRAGAAAWDGLAIARERGERIRVVAGMRDPVARSISMMVFMIDFYGHTVRPLSARADVSAQYVIDTLAQTWRDVIERREPDSTFEWFLWFMTGAFRGWFSEEFTAAYGIDLLALTPRSWSGSRRIDTGDLEILLYRAEDMAPSATEHADLLRRASAFLDTSLAGFPKVNTSDTRRSKSLSAEVQNRFRLPRVLIDAIYDAPIVRYFYRDDEIAGFRERWLEKATAD